MNEMQHVLALARREVDPSDAVDTGSPRYAIAQALLDLAGKLEPEVLAEFFMSNENWPNSYTSGYRATSERSSAAIRAHCGLTTGREG